MTNLRKRLPPLTSLAAFETVCRLGSFTKAAYELNLTQAAVSRQIIKIEHDLGVTLFERRSHDVGLTHEGERFARTVNPAINAIGDAAQIMRASGSESNQLIIFSEMCLAAYLIVPLMPKFQAMFPQVNIKLLTSSKPMEDLLETFDIGFQYGAADKRVFTPLSTWSDEIIVVCSPEFRRTLPEKCSIQDLQVVTLIHTQQAGAGWMSWSGFFESYGANLMEKKASLVFNAHNSAIDAAISGGGIVLGWRFIVNRAIDEGKLVQIENYSVSSPDNLHAYARKNHDNSHMVKKYIRWLREVLTNTTFCSAGKT
jgi:LysR family glycine cleavage system transcriptional activator